MQKSNQKINQASLYEVGGENPVETLKEVHPILEDISVLARKVDRWQTELAGESVVDIKENISNLYEDILKTIEEYENYPVYGDLTSAPFYEDTIRYMDWVRNIAEKVDRENKEVTELLDDFAWFFEKWQEHAKSLADEVEKRDKQIMVLKKTVEKQNEELEFLRGKRN